MRVLLATDRVGALPAREVAAALAQGWGVERPDDDVRELPLSDGSAGLLDVLPTAGREVVVVPGPLGDDIPAGLARTGSTWWIDADDVLGARLVGGRVAESLERGSSAGLGVLLRHAAAAGAGRVVVGLGPAGVHDAGSGLVHELGVPGPDEDGHCTIGGRGLDADGAAGAGPDSPTGPVPGDASAIDDLAERVRRAADRLAGLDVVLALGVDEPLTGLHGTGAQLAERHGLDPVAAQDLDGRTGRAAEQILRAAADLPRRTSLPLAGPPDASGAAAAHAGHAHAAPAADARLTTRTDGGGAGGGAGLALLALGARAFEGADVVADELGLADALDELEGVGLVVTSASEVGPDEARRSVLATVGRAAAARALPVVAVGRTVSSSRRELAPTGVSATAALVPGRHPDEAPAADDPVALRRALVDRGARLARTWSRP
ncbi:glycerate kinase [Georgenia sp. Z1344]|uniref:glycerate kinase n=1 Tax=Georgenia sp. Z1344 TaxID=3416706 RepID=UPI003CF48F29